jgi:hypothetical protein
MLIKEVSGQTADASNQPADAKRGQEGILDSPSQHAMEALRLRAN